MKVKFIAVIKKIITPSFWKNVAKTIYMFTVFFILLLFFLISRFVSVLEKIPILGRLVVKISQIWQDKTKENIDKLIRKLASTRKDGMNRDYLINLAYKNLLAKRTRSFITILGMSVGVGAIVLLLSLGYGVERLIVSKVATLDELKMIDVSAGENTALRLSRDTLKKIVKIAKVSNALPLISVVGRISYNKATTDVLVYAAPKSYLKLSKLKLIRGNFFANNQDYSTNISLNKEKSFGEVAGISTSLQPAEYSTKVNSNTTYFNILPEETAIVWEDCSITSKMLGYTIRIEGGYSGEEYWGSDYYPFNNKGREGYDKKQQLFLGKWLMAKVPLFQKDIDGGLQPILDDFGKPKWDKACIQQKNIQTIDKYLFGSVLGESTASAQLTSATSSADLTNTATDSAQTNYNVVTTASSSGGLELISLQATASAVKKSAQTLKFSKPPDGEAVVSSGLLNMLDIPVNKAIGDRIKVSFIVVKSLMPEIEGRLLTSEVEYKIVGVIDDVDNSFFYIPFSDMEKLAIKHFSQIKVIVNNKNDLPAVRKHIETIGLRTSSTVDTVKQIESLFANLRIILAILGMVALAVASLGMFNTLTVSLLERTREIGGMKTMGMVSDEVQDLFLAEAMIMGLSGGVGGLLLGFIVGKVISCLISIIAVASGQGFLDLTYIPLGFIIFILLSSFIVGIVTGLYPAQRAKKISALNALRYE